MSTLQDYIDEARREFGAATPYRVGWLVGRGGADIPCPYAAGSRGALSYHRGKEDGRRNAEKAKLSAAASSC